MRDAVPKPKYLFSFSFLSGTDDPFQRGEERGTRCEETGETAKERKCRERKRREDRGAPHDTCMYINPCMHTDTVLSGLDEAAPAMESGSESEKSK